MTWYLRDARGIRLLPILVAALAALGTVKIASIILVGSYILTPVEPAIAQEAPGKLRQDKLMTGKNSNAPSKSKRDRRIEFSGSEVPVVSESERSLLESLRQRREEIDERERALAMQEQLLKAAEQRIVEKVAELKAIEARVTASFKAKDEEDNEQLASLVKMYEAMKPKNAARIFDRLELGVLVGVARKMKPADLADVISAMDPAVAERVTIELANISRQRVETTMDELAPVTPQ